MELTMPEFGCHLSVKDQVKISLLFLILSLGCSGNLGFNLSVYSTVLLSFFRRFLNRTGEIFPSTCFLLRVLWSKTALS